MRRGGRFGLRRWGRLRHRRRSWGLFSTRRLIARRSNVSARKSGRNLRAHDERQRRVSRRSEDLDFADKTIRSLTSGYSNRALRRSLEMANTQKTAIVTGASQRIGAGLVEEFLKRDYNVVGNSRNITTANPCPASANLGLVD